MADTKHYSLRWDQHASNLVAEAECFFQDEAFLDCTLSAEGQSLQAHRLVLSAASPYLASLLRVTGDKQPILIFNDMPFEVLKAIVSFIYNGRVDVPEPAVQPFLHAAQTLLLRGLSQVAATVKSPVPPVPPPPPLMKQARRVYGKRSLFNVPPLPPTTPDTALRLQEVAATKIPAPHRTGDNDQFVVRNWRLSGGPSETNGKPPPPPQPPGYLFKKFRLEKPPTEEPFQEPPTGVKKFRVERPSPPFDEPPEPSVAVKQEPESEEVMELIVEPKVEVEEEEEDTNYPEGSQSHGVPVPLLVCKTSLQEDEGGWQVPEPDISWQHNSEAEELPCNTCHKKYRSRYALNRHVLYECGKARKSFSCDECGKKVTRQDTLQKHKLIHLVQHMKDKESSDS